jgi:hypothetical protein
VSEVAHYIRDRRDGWSLWLDPTRWRDQWWNDVQHAIEGGGALVRASRHARTSILELGADAGRVRLFAKVYRSSGWEDDVKDVWRVSKAVNALRASIGLAEDGFVVPRVIAAGELRRVRRLQRAFLLSEEVAWKPLPRLAEDLARDSNAVTRELRRGVAAHLGAEVARFHRRGWVHGDLVATNLLVDGASPSRICFLDNDRTWRVRLPWRQLLERRNLVQLNRLLLAGVSNSDRLRFFVRYAAALGWERPRWRREARRLAAATLRRRLEIARLARRGAPLAAR